MKLLILGFVLGFIFRSLAIRLIKWYIRNRELFLDLKMYMEDFREEYKSINKQHKRGYR